MDQFVKNLGGIDSWSSRVSLSSSVLLYKTLNSYTSIDSRKGLSYIEKQIGKQFHINSKTYFKVLLD